jgi:glycosyltransferase involved in cell wall biosynthesis
MKILQVSSFMPPHPGGLELAVQNLVIGLRERGHQLRWIASAAPLPAGTEGDLIRVAAFKRMEELLHVPIPLWGPSGYGELARQIRWADLVHAHDCLYPSSLAALWLANRLGRPSVLTQHIARVPYGRALELVQGLAYRTLGRNALERATRVVAYSAHVPPYFAQLGVRCTIELVPLGFDARFAPTVRGDRARLRHKYGVPDDGKIVLFAGRLVPKKGVAEIVAVQRLLAARGYTLVVAGDGAQAHLLRDVPRCVQLRNVGYVDMHELYALADVLLLPSRGEGLPLTLQEAMLTGLPAVVSEDPSYRANVAEAPGVYLREGVPAWTEAVVQAATSAAPAAVIAEWATRHFGRTASLNGHERVYRAACSAFARRARGAACGIQV